MNNKTNIAVLESVKQFSTSIKQKHWELIMYSNYELLSLFWHCGHIYNNYSKTLHEKGGQPAFGKAINQLKKEYGGWFSPKQLKLMGLFANTYDNSDLVLAELSLVSWEHNLLLLQIGNKQTRRLYLKEIVEKGLSVKNLREKLLNDFKYTSDVATNIPTKTQLQKSVFATISLGQTNINYQVVKNVYKSPLSARLNPLLANEVKYVSEVNTSAITDKVEQILGEFYGCIANFQYLMKTKLNTRLNIFFREFGETMNIELNKTDTVGQSLLLATWGNILEKKYGQNFNSTNLLAMSLCAKQFDTVNIYLPIANSLSWEHIIPLLSLDSLEAKMFYARLCSKQGLTAHELKNIIKANLFESTDHAQESELEGIIKLKNAPITNTTIKKHGNKTVEINSYSIKIEDDFKTNYAIPVVLKNRTLMSFLNFS